MDSRRPHRRGGGKLRLIGWIAYWLLIFTLTHIPLTIPLSAPAHSDLLAHFLMYFGLAVAGGGYLSSLFVGRRLRLRLALWFVVFLFYGAFDEWLQQYVHRTMSLTDWLADAAGLVAGMLFLLWRMQCREYRNQP